MNHQFDICTNNYKQRCNLSIFPGCHGMDRSRLLNIGSNQNLHIKYC